MRVDSPRFRATDLGFEVGEPRSVAPRYQPRQYHLGCLVMHDQTPQSQDLWHRDVLP